MSLDALARHLYAVLATDAYCNVVQAGLPGEVARCFNWPPRFGEKQTRRCPPEMALVDEIYEPVPGRFPMTLSVICA